MNNLSVPQIPEIVKPQFSPPAWRILPDPDFDGYIGYLTGQEIAYGPTRSKCYQNLLDALVIRHKHARLNPIEAVNWDSAPVEEVAQ